MLRVFVAVVVLGILWLHWRAAYTSQVRAALADLAAGSRRLDDLIEDVRDKRLAYHCAAVLRAYRAGDTALCEVHVANALERVEHLERFAPVRRRVRPIR